MREQESYWLRKGPHLPEVADLPQGAFSGGERAWESLSPGYRRTIWREAIQREAKGRGLPEDILFRLRVATIDGTLGSLDEYLAQFERVDAARPAIREDADRLQRADELNRKGEVQIAAREAL